VDSAGGRLPAGGGADGALTGGAVVGTASGVVGGPGLSAAPLRGRVVRVVQAIDGSTCVEVSVPGQRTVPTGSEVEIVPDGHGSRADVLAQEVTALRLEAQELRDIVQDALDGRPIAALAAALGVTRGA